TSVGLCGTLGGDGALVPSPRRRARDPPPPLSPRPGEWPRPCHTHRTEPETDTATSPEDAHEARLAAMAHARHLRVDLHRGRRVRSDLHGIHPRCLVRHAATA